MYKTYIVQEYTMLLFLLVITIIMQESDEQKLRCPTVEVDTFVHVCIL